MSAGNGNGDVRELERQLERGSLFAHSALGRGAIRLREVEAFVYGLADALLGNQLVTTAELAGAVADVRRELDEAADVPEPGVALRVDEPDAAAEPPAEVDCGARMHVCHAVCCKLDFALSADEVERGVIRWDLGRPYMVRHAESGYCVHNDDSSRHCTIYENRPRPCRVYSCVHDSRIWNDFDAMELNTDWLEENVVGQTHPQLLQAMLASATTAGGSRA